MKFPKITYEVMAERFKKQGLTETRAAVAAKLKREKFLAMFLLQCVAALGLESVELKDM